MKNLILLMLLFVMEATANEVVISELVDFSTRTKTVWRIDADSFAEEKPWDGSGPPPLDVALAVKMARTALQKNRTERGLEFRLRSVSLRPPISGTERFPGRFVYIVEFEEGGKRHSVVLLMSGKIVPATQKAMEAQ